MSGRCVPCRVRHACGALCVVAGLMQAAPVLAQELEPRAYVASPVGTNFIATNLAHASGQVLLDPSLPIADVQARIDSYSIGYARTFAIARRAANVAVVLPFARADIHGKVLDVPAEAHRSGVGDVRLRLAMNVLGGEALSPQAFARRPPSPTAGLSLSVIAPTGQYQPTRLINVGTNRWAFKPEAGVALPLGNWFTEASAGVWLFADNHDFFGGRRRSQEGLRVFQAHAGYRFTPGFWLAADIGHYAGGRTTLNGVAKDDRREDTRYGLTLSIPLGASWSTKLAWSNGLTTRSGGDFDVFSWTLQYRWFD